MKTTDEFIEYLNGRTFVLDDRTGKRFTKFLPVERWQEIGFKIADGYDVADIEQYEWSEDNIIEQLKDDVAFGFEKALNQRGISASLMRDVVCDWLYALEHPLYEFASDEENYYPYALPVFRSVAAAFGFNDPSGDG